MNIILYIAMCIYWKIWDIVKCLILTCEYRMGVYVFSPVQNMNLKIVYGLKTSKTADLDVIFFIFYTSTCIMFMVGGYPYLPP